MDAYDCRHNHTRPMSAVCGECLAVGLRQPQCEEEDDCRFTIEARLQTADYPHRDGEEQDLDDDVDRGYGFPSGKLRIVSTIT